MTPTKSVQVITSREAPRDNNISTKLSYKCTCLFGLFGRRGGVEGHVASTFVSPQCTSLNSLIRKALPLRQPRLCSYPVAEAETLGEHGLSNAMETIDQVRNAKTMASEIEKPSPCVSTTGRRRAAGRCRETTSTRSQPDPMICVRQTDSRSGEMG